MTSGAGPAGMFVYRSSTAISALIDNIIFDSLAWVVFPDCSAHRRWALALVFTYIIGTYWIRLPMAVAEAPLIYLAGWFPPPEDRLRHRQEGPSPSWRWLSAANLICLRPNSGVLHGCR